MLRFAQMQLYKPKITNNCNFFEYYLFFVFFCTNGANATKSHCVLQDVNLNDNKVCLC